MARAAWLSLQLAAPVANSITFFSTALRNGAETPVSDFCPVSCEAGCGAPTDETEGSCVDDPEEDCQALAEYCTDDYE